MNVRVFSNTCPGCGIVLDENHMQAKLEESSKELGADCNPTVVIIFCLACEKRKDVQEEVLGRIRGAIADPLSEIEDSLIARVTQHPKSREVYEICDDSTIGRASSLSLRPFDLSASSKDRMVQIRWESWQQAYEKLVVA